MISNDVAMEGIGESEVSDQLHEPLADDIPVDSNWDDIYPQTPSGASAIATTMRGPTIVRKKH